MKAGQTEKGTATLEKVVEIDGKPDTLNNTGYVLADANVDLPKALEYAQRAVDGQEKESHDVELSNLLPDDLICTQKIAYDWDTLGWAHFRSGHLAQAEDYLRAAWLLSQYSVNADHLGQVYEQEKKTEKADHMYRLALAAPDGREDLDATRHRLERLGRKPAGDLFHPDPIRDELSQMRTVKLKHLAPEQASAEFFLLFRPGAKHPDAELEDVQFISGSEAMKPLGDALYDADFQLTFPEGSSAHLVRRAIVMCSKLSGCQAVLYTPDSVHSVQ